VELTSVCCGSQGTDLLVVTAGNMCRRQWCSYDALYDLS